MILDNPSFDYSIVGYSLDGKLIYDYNKMVEEYFNDNKDSGIEYVDAIEFIEYNTMRALPYMGDRAPIIMFKDDLTF